MIEGPYLAKKAVMDYLAADLPTRLIDYRTHWSLSEEDLPNPRVYFPYEPLRMDKWPAIYTVVASTSEILRDDFGADEAYFSTRYAARTYVWVNTVGQEDCTAMRDRMMAVVRSALLDHPALTIVGNDLDCSVLIDDTTMREEYSDIAVEGVKGQRFVSGGYISYDLKQSEGIEWESVDGLGVVTSVLLNVYLLEKLPNAPAYVLGETGENSGEIDLWWRACTWNGEDGDITGYKIESSIDDGENWTTEVADTESSVPTYTVTDLTPGETYWFRVSGINSEGIGAASASSIPIVAAE